MFTKTKIAFAAALIAAVASPAFAQDEYLVDSGRYVDGQVPSFTQQEPTFGAHKQLVEGRNAAVIGGYHATVNEPLVPADRASVMGN